MQERLPGVTREGLRRTTRRRIAGAVAILVATVALGTARAAEQTLPVMTTLVVPAVGSITGLGGVRWVTSLALRNDTGGGVDVWLILPGALDAPAYSISMAPGQTVMLPDLIRDAFGAESALSPLKIITSGRRSVTASVTVFAMRDGAVAASEPVAIDYSGSSYPVRSLPGLSFSEDYRTNIGLANLSETGSAAFVLALQRINGRNITVSRLVVPPLTLVHTSIQSLFPMITKGDDFTVVVESGQRDTYVYGSVIHNQTVDARFVPPVIGAIVESAAP